MHTTFRLWLLALLVSFGLLLAPTPAAAADDGRRVYKDDKGDEEEMSEEEKKAAEEAAQKRRDRAARVVVLKWNGTDVGYEDELLRRIVRNRIDRPDALFFPSTDLYQNGRKAPDRTLTPAMQPARVADADLTTLVAEAERVSQIPWNGLGPDEWRGEAAKLRDLLDTTWFIEGIEQREPLFLAYANIGRAAENSGSQAPPFFEAIAGKSVNYYYYLAASLAFQDPTLMSKLLDQEVNGAVNYYLSEMQKGAFPTFPLDFELDGEFDIEQFEKEYQVFLNGVEVTIDAEARVEVLLGRSDIYLKRKDTGHGLSERLEVDKFEDKAYFVRDVARKRMGLEFIEQLMLHPNECTPEVAEYVLHYMAIYAKLHPKPAEIYVAVPKNGDPNKVWIWRYDRQSATLQLVGGGQDEFPVRFAFVASTGVMYNGAAFSVDSTVDNTDINSLDDPVGNAADRASYDLQSAHLPVNLTLRGHYNRLMVGFGFEFGYNLAGDGLWVERYRTPEHKFDYGDLMVVEAGPAEENEDGSAVNGPEVYHYKAWSRYTHFDVGVVFGPNAGRAFGPRLALSTGWTDLPHAWVLLGHFGWSLEVPLDVLHVGQRIRPLVDVDARGGMAYTLGDSIQTDLAKADPDQLRIKPVFGLTAGIGTTF